MRIIRDIQFVDPGDRGASAAIGNFDGVHLGHQAVLEIAKAAGDAVSAPLGVMTFEPHPREQSSGRHSGTPCALYQHGWSSHNTRR